VAALDAARPRHVTRVVNREGNDECFEVECELCGFVAAADTCEEAEGIRRLHEEFVAVLIERWRMPL